MITAKTSNIDPVVNILVRAFSADPVARWIYPDCQQYAANFPNFVKAFAGAAFDHGSAHCVEDFTGAAIWLPPGVHADDKALAAILQDTIPERRQAEVCGLFEQLDKWHPAEPHWYLPMIGVDPAKQGNGYGSALLKHSIERCDGENKLAYLESSSPKNIPLYQRHGFESLGTIQVGSSPPLFPMVRKPRRFTAGEKGALASVINQQAGVA
jgi:ribosomal protein S18 acetylase RimI-like enzyme